jgi:hypothetical protein
LIFRAGGILFAAEPDAALTGPEREALGRLDPADGAGEAPFRIDLAAEAPWTSADPALFPQWEPAVLRWSGGRLLSSHRSFTAEIDPVAARARLFRREERAYPLETVIRTAMMARLPLVGGLPLHAAGVVIDRWTERADGVVAIEATIFVERDSQKGIVIGKGGGVLKEVGVEARQDIERLIDHKVFLSLRVEVRPDWRNDPRVLGELGIG